MRVRVTMPSKDGKRLKDTIMALVSKVEDDDWSENWELVRRRVQNPLSRACIAADEPS